MLTIKTLSFSLIFLAFWDIECIEDASLNQPVTAQEEANDSKYIPHTLVMPNFKRPHNNCYWVEPGNFLAGEYPRVANEKKTRQRLRNYLNAGITFFIDLTQERELNPRGPRKPYAQILKEEAAAKNISVIHHRMPIEDNTVPTAAFMIEIINLIHRALIAGHKVYVHCWAGIGRTGTVVGCYLVSKGMTGEQALKHLAALWKTVAKSKINPQTPNIKEQQRFVKMYGKPLGYLS